MRRLLTLLFSTGLAVAIGAGPALACGGLVAPNGSVNLTRTTTLAAYKDGVEQYVTSFEFSGAGGGKFGSIVPLPDVPTKVRRGGRWTLQRLVQEIQPPVLFAAGADGLVLDESARAKVLLETQVGALDITILEGGGDEVGNWARANGFSLPPDAPEVLDFYAERSPIFMAARFNLKRARANELTAGDGVAIHLTIPTDQPWVPLRILGLGRQANELIEADVFLLTEHKPAMLPVANPAGTQSGMVLERSEEASSLLLADLRSDRGMGWLPGSDMWLSYLRINAEAGSLTHDLALSTSGTPSPVAAGIQSPREIPLPLPDDASMWWPWLLAAATAAGVVWLTNRVVAKRT
jgi:hypothetical protein